MKNMEANMMRAVEPFKEWCFKAHEETNHHYDDELPYSFHLKAVVREIDRNIILLYNPAQYDQDGLIFSKRFALYCAGYGHDVIEDTRKSYNDVLNAIRFSPYGSVNPVSVMTAEMIRAVTNIGRGRNRSERMPDSIYEEIRNTTDADFLKICDRLANVKYSIFTGSRMTDMYAKENDAFVSKVTSRPGTLQPMLDELKGLFK